MFLMFVRYAAALLRLLRRAGPALAAAETTTEAPL
jgi:hypothetical protein